MINNRFYIPVEDGKKVINLLISRLKSDGYETQAFSQDNQTLIQAKRGGALRTIFGTSTAININVNYSSDSFDVDFSNGKWVGKGVVGGIGAFVVFWPLLVTAGIGAYNQSELSNKILNIIRKEITKHFETQQNNEKITFLASYHEGLDINVHVTWSKDDNACCCYIQDSEGTISCKTPCFGTTEDGDPKVEFCFYNINNKLEVRVIVAVYDDGSIQGIIQSF